MLFSNGHVCVSSSLAKGAARGPSTTHLRLDLNGAVRPVADIAQRPGVWDAPDAHLLIDGDESRLRQQSGREIVGVGDEACGRQVKVGDNGLAVGQHQSGAAIGLALRSDDPGAPPNADAEPGKLPFEAGGGRMSADEVIAGGEQVHLLVPELVAQLASQLNTRGAGAGDDDVRSGLDPAGEVVQRLQGLLVRAVCLPRHVLVDGARARGQHEVVVRDGPTGHGCRLGRRVERRDGADDELNAFPRVTREALGDGAQDASVVDLARDDGPHGRYVPVEVAVLEDGGCSVRGARRWQPAEGGRGRGLSYFGDEDDFEVRDVGRSVLEQPMGHGEARIGAADDQDGVTHVMASHGEKAR